MAGIASWPGAAELPTAPVRPTVGFPPGGGTDVAARLVAEKLAVELGQPVIVDNRAGAGGTIGALAVARVAPNGYTPFFGSSAELLINPLTRKVAPYDVLKDFAPITEDGAVQFALVVPAGSPMTSVPSLVSQATARPGALNFSSFGTGSTNHMIGGALPAVHRNQGNSYSLPRKRAGHDRPAGGNVDFAFETAAVAMPQVKAGKLRALATPSGQRLKELPNVPTLVEAGPKGFVAEGWMGVFAPAATPADVLARLSLALVKVLHTPDVVSRMSERNVVTVGSSAEDFRRKLSSESEKWRRVAATSGISLD